MKKVLKRKQGSSNADWLEVWSHITDYITLDEVLVWVDQTLAEMRRVLADHQRVGFGWSGGKDSLVLGHLMDSLGEYPGVNVRIPAFEYSVHTAWFETHRPPNVSLHVMDLDDDWLLAHPKFLFPTDPAMANRWREVGLRPGQYAFYHDQDLDLMVYGRRYADGNFVGKDGIHTAKASGLKQYCPIRSWPHEVVLGYVHYHGLSLSPLYAMPQGFVRSVEHWPRRAVGEAEGWRLTYAIEPPLVERLAGIFPGARRFLDGL